MRRFLFQETNNYMAGDGGRGGLEAVWTSKPT
jgi:hypothetical protein